MKVAHLKKGRKKALLIGFENTNLNDTPEYNLGDTGGRDFDRCANQGATLP
jgi:hypothetical protein